MTTKHLTTRVWLICAASALAFVTALIWYVNGSPTDALKDPPDEKYPFEVLLAEAEQTYMELEAQGIRVMAYTAKEQYNAAVVVVHPDDKAKLRVTQRGVPEKRYYRLIREEGNVPVYIEFEGPYSTLPG